MERAVARGLPWADLGLLATLAVVTPGCQTVDVPSMAAAPPGRFVPEEDERRLWDRAKEFQGRIRLSGALYEDAALTEYVNVVLRRLVPESVMQAGLSIEVRIIKNSSLNAFALPNGAI
jgi:predicted Zn-dependent protease